MLKLFVFYIVTYGKTIVQAENVNVDEVIDSTRKAFEELSAGFEPTANRHIFTFVGDSECCGRIAGNFSMSHLTVADRTAITVNPISQDRQKLEIHILDFTSTFAFNEGAKPQIEFEGQISAGGKDSGGALVNKGTYNCRLSAGLEGARGRLDGRRLVYPNSEKVPQRIVNNLIFDDGILRSPSVKCTGAVAALLNQDAARLLEDSDINTGVSLRRVVVGAIASLASRFPKNLKEWLRFSRTTDCCGKLSGILGLKRLTVENSDFIDFKVTRRTVGQPSAFGRTSSFDADVNFADGAGLKLFYEHFVQALVNNGRNYFCQVSVDLTGARGTISFFQNEHKTDGFVDPSQIVQSLHFSAGTYRSPSVKCEVAVDKASPLYPVALAYKSAVQKEIEAIIENEPLGVQIG